MPLLNCRSTTVKSNPSNVAAQTSLITLPIGSLSTAPGGQARQNFAPATLHSLAASLRRSGVRTPILVAPDPTAPGNYCIVAGERRWRAAKLAGLTKIPCFVDDALTDPKQRLLAQAEENLHREDLNFVEEAAVLVQLMEAFGVGAEEAGALIGRSYRQARQLIQIHNAPRPIRDAIVQGHINARAALELVRIYNKLAHEPGSPGKQRALADLDELIDRVVNERWTIRRLERYARNLVDAGPQTKARPRAGSGGAPPNEPVRDGSARQPALAVAPSAAPFRRLENGVFIDAGRIARRQVSPKEREELIKILEELLMAVRRAV
jgi:ParB family chromosome partitioning protein